jgi:hypothetical protein
MTRVLPLAAVAALAVLGWWADPRALLASYLAAWWFAVGTLMGGLANVWLHNLTGGAWGEAIRGQLLARARLVPLACLLFIPLLAGTGTLYPWAAHEAAGMARWHQGFTDPHFKDLWLARPFFTGRALAYLATWAALSWLARRPGLERSRGMAAAGLLAYVLTVSLAAVDWIMSLQPEWYSSVFGWLAATGQMLAGLALAIVMQGRVAARKVLPDLGNLLLMYVLAWGYLAYVQFLIIWAENLPHEIGWYLRRATPGWSAVAWVLLAAHFAAPLLILLSRRAKQAPAMLAALAWALLGAHLLDCWWLVMPGVAGLSLHWLWLAPSIAVSFALAWLWRDGTPLEEPGHA